MAQKSLCITYLLWLFGGFFGLHHFYLNRDYHALVWWMFAGGYFGAGWLRDIWRIPEYVRDANEEPSYILELAKNMMKNEKPPTGYFRYFGQMMVADTFGYLIINALPKELISDQVIQFSAAFTAPGACALGVYLVGNIGRHQGKLKPAIIGAYLTAPLYFMIDSPVFLSSIFASYVFNSHSKEWRRTPKPKKSFSQRLTFIIFCGTLYFSLWSSWLYFNCKITYQNEEEVKCRDAAKHFFKSPMWREFVSVMKELWQSIQIHGWRKVWNQIVEAFDPIGEKNALKVLGLDPSATQQEITSRYRKLSREWHPDKHKDPASKEEAQEKFIEIQQAYEILSKIKSERITQNIKNPDYQNEEKHGEL